MGKRPFYRKVRQTLHETVSDSGKSVLCYRGNNDKIYYVASSNDPNVEPGGRMIEVTWQELKNKRDAGELIPGCLYRITDYQCTTTQENTKSAGHQFDIVLLALSENKLAEEGWVMHHAGDTYFANSNLSAWKVWYCLDNDKSRFAWAMDGTGVIILWGEEFIRKKEGDVSTYNLVAWYNVNEGYIYTKNENPQKGDTIYGSEGEESESDVVEGIIIGRGVIYRLIDEWNNDVPYDFKNIMLSVGTGKDAYGYLFSRSNYIGDRDYSINGAFVNVSIAQYPTYTGDKGGFINSIESGILVPLLRTGERLQDIKIASGYLTSNGQIDQLSSHSIMGYSIESSKESSKT